MDLPLPPSWNPHRLSRREGDLLKLAAIPDAAIRKRQRGLAAAGLWLLAAALLAAVAADLLHWALDAWSPLMAVPGLFLLLRAWEINHLRTARRVLRRMCGQDPA